jgi:aminobenzoyl-glutamate utilization protein B
MLRKIIIGVALAQLAVGLNQVVAQNIAAMKKATLEQLDTRQPEYEKIAKSIWELAEVGYKEKKSSALLQELLRKEGFQIQTGVAGMPTAFIASYGSGSPVIALLAEYDALPGLAQQEVPEKKPITGQDAGHGCGHNLFGTASAAAAISLKQWMSSGQLKGTIRVYGCPAEEGGSGKVYLVRDGYFKDVDIALHWHPKDKNFVTMGTRLANTSAKFRFYGTAAHASMAPERGRSALDGVEAMDYMVNMMREHVPQETRIHYVITQGGKAPNVVPDFAEVFYYVRHPKREQVQAIFERLIKTAEGAAKGTETRMEYEIIGGTHDLLINKSLARLMQQNLEMTGGVTYSAEEILFANKLAVTLTNPPPIATASEILPLPNEIGSGAGEGSTDVGDVSYAVPTVGLETATWIPGVVAHSWQAVACNANGIGYKGMLVAAKTMALTAIDLFSNNAFIQEAKAEHRKQIGNYQYRALLGNRPPALNYRD